MQSVAIRDQGSIITRTNKLVATCVYTPYCSVADRPQAVKGPSIQDVVYQDRTVPPTTAKKQIAGNLCSTEKIGPSAPETTRHIERNSGDRITNETLPQRLRVETGMIGLRRVAYGVPTA